MKRSSTARPNRRSDASNNRELLLDAAEKLFQREGVNVSLDLIPKQAGIGRATLFRNFPDRQALLIALLGRALDRLEVKAKELDDDPHAALKLFGYCAEQILANGPLIEYWQAMDPRGQELKAALARYIKIFSRPLRRAVATGQCRADLRPPDVVLLSALLSSRMLHTAKNRRKLLGRAWALMIAAAGFKYPHGFADTATAKVIP